MIVLECPNCGPRNVTEFRYGGEVQRRPQPDPELGDWTRYLYTRRNPLGTLREWWFHEFGCRRWFIGERHTKEHEIHATYLWDQRPEE